MQLLQKIGFLAKSISKFNGCATAMPTEWELNCLEFSLEHIDRKYKLIYGNY